MSEFKDDTFLARWLNNELNDDELNAFKESEEYLVYDKIKKGSELINSEKFDEAEILRKIKGQRQLEIGRKTPTRKRWIYSAAASILVLLSFAVYIVFFSSQLTVYQTKVGEKRNVTLPDGSEVVLNANSSLSFSTDSWDSNRELTLTGEGYFKVEKGERFIVHTGSGDVSVLGTQFTIQELDDFFQVICFEGSVKVESGEEVEVLKPKKSIRKMRGAPFARRDISTAEPSWIKNESSFTSVSLKYVFKEIENQYGVRFEGKDVVGNLTFSGSFPHDNLGLALKIVLDPINVNYEQKENVIVIGSN